MNKEINVDIKKLLNLISEDSRSAFNLFYDIYYEQIFRFAYYFARDVRACREIVAETFLSVWQSRLKLTNVGHIETYLFIVVRNEATRYRNCNRKERFVSIDDVSILPADKPEGSIESQLIFEEMEKRLNRIVEELPEKCRLIFLLARQEGLKPKEIAERLSITESTVRVQMKIAVEKIIKQIKPYYPDITFSLLFSTLF